MSLIDSTFKEYVVSHRINFSNWKLVDLDNYMQGNSYFAKVTTAELWQQDFDNVVGPKDQLLKPITNILDKQKLS